MLCPLTQGAKLIAPPVVGFPEMREARVWVQTDEPAQLHLAYWPKGSPEKRKRSNKVTSRAEDANTAILVTGALMPGQTYEYEVLVEGSAAAFDYPTHFTTAPMFRGYNPPPDFVVAAGSGHYVNDQPFDPLNRTPGGDYDVFLSILSQSPNLMLWAGNNVHLREADAGSRAGMLDRYTKSRAPEQMAPLLASVPNAAVWGPQDYGDPARGRFFRNRELSREVFELFWPNPAPEEDALLSAFTYGDAEFFLLDVNSERDTFGPKSSEHDFLGDEQIEWLIRQLRSSQATFKIVVAGAAIVNPAEDPDQATAAKDERDAFLNALLAARVNGVIFVTGGKNYGELTRMVRPNAPVLYELGLGPLTQRADASSTALNYFREPSTATFRRQFALLRFHGPEADRKLTFEVRDVQGNQLWTRTISSKDLSY